MLLSFLNPALLLLLPLISIPVIIHLAHKRRYVIVNWSAMEFLFASEQKSLKKRRIHQLILLILRILILLIIILAASRPLFKATDLSALVAKSSTHAIIILDDSYSMSYSAGNLTLFDKCKNAAKEIISLLKEGDAVSVITCSGEAKVIETSSYLLQNVKRNLDALKISNKTTDMQGAIALAVDLIEKRSTLPNKEVYIVSDCQAYPWDKKTEEENDIFTRLSGMATRVFVIKVAKQKEENAAVVNVNFPRWIVDSFTPARIASQIKNFGKEDLRNLVVNLYVDEQLKESKKLYVKAGESVPISFICQFAGGGIHTGYVQSSLDPLTIDNKCYFSVNVREKIKVLCIDGGVSSAGKTNETWYLADAYSPYNEKTKNIIEVDVKESSGSGMIALGNYKDKLYNYDVVVLANVYNLPLKDEVDALEKYVRRGGGLFVALGDKVIANIYNSSMARLMPCALEKTVGNAKIQMNVFKMATLDMQHPFFSAFSQEQESELKNNVNIYQYFKSKVDPEDQNVAVLAKFENSDPAFVEKRLGYGKIILFTSTVSAAWTDFPVRPTFLPFFQQLVFYQIASEKNKSLKVGERIIKTIGYKEYKNVPPVVLTPMQESASASITSLEGGEGFQFVYDKTDIPGNYKIKYDPKGMLLNDSIAVNLDFIESDIKGIDGTELHRIYPKASFKFIAEETNLKDTLTKERKGIELWKILAYCALFIALCESILAQYFGNQWKAERTGNN